MLDSIEKENIIVQKNFLGSVASTQLVGTDYRITLQLLNLVDNSISMTFFKVICGERTTFPPKWMIQPRVLITQNEIEKGVGEYLRALQNYLLSIVPSLPCLSFYIVNF